MSTTDDTKEFSHQHPEDCIIEDYYTGMSTIGDAEELSCQHPEDRIIEDHHTGDNVCTLCGLVLEERCGQNPFLIENEKNKILIPERDNRFDKLLQKVNGILSTTFACLHIESEQMIRDALAIYEKMMKKKRSINYRIDHRIIAYSIYTTCIHHNCPRNTKVIASLCGVKPKAILDVEKIFQLSGNVTHPESFVELMSAFLDIPYFIIILIKKYLKLIEAKLIGHKPETMAAAGIFFIHEKFRHTYVSPHLSKLNLSNLGKTLNISIASLRMILKKFPLCEITCNLNKCGEMKYGCVLSESSPSIFSYSPNRGLFVCPNSN